MGFSLGAPGAFERLLKLGLSLPRVKLQGLVFLGESLELLLHLAHWASCFSRSMRSLAALSSASDSAFFRAATSVLAPIKIHDDPMS